MKQDWQQVACIHTTHRYTTTLLHFRCRAEFSSSPVADSVREKQKTSSRRQTNVRYKIWHDVVYLLLSIILHQYPAVLPLTSPEM
ncbi:MAG: hypothetical protein ACFFGP_15970, partial [Promethearchaeota archaeon]